MAQPPHRLYELPADDPFARPARLHPLPVARKVAVRKRVVKRLVGAVRKQAFAGGQVKELGGVVDAERKPRHMARAGEVKRLPRAYLPRKQVVKVLPP